MTTARSIVDEMDRLFPQSSMTLQAHHLLGDKVNGWGKLAFLKSPDFKQTKNSLTIPEKYDLVGTFPNPFNPSTTIRYALPRLSTVEVTVYNLLSQKVKAFTIASQPAGLHDLVWEGTRYSNKLRAHSKSTLRI